MCRNRHLVGLLVCAAVSGCLAAPPIAVSTKQSLTKGTDEQVAEEDRAYNINDPGERQEMLAVLVREEIASAPLGSDVSVTDGSQHDFRGTLVKSEADRIELINCITKEAVPGPGGIKQCKTSHIPLQSFPITELTRFTVISPPQPGFKVPDITEDSSSATISEIVFRDGHSVGKRPEAEPAE